MFGVSTFCLHSLSLADTLDRLAAVTDYIEIMDEGIHHLDGPEVLETYTTRFSIHAPSRGTNLASLLEPIRRASVEVMDDCFRCAAEVNASVVLHPGYFAWEEERARAEACLKRSLGELHQCADEYSVDFYIENMGNWGYFLLKTPDEMPLIGTTPLALDVGHAHLNGCLEQFLQLPAQHYHLHDNNGTEDTHVAVGEGTIDFGAVMKVVRKNGVQPIIEVSSFEALIASIEALNKL